MEITLFEQRPSSPVANEHSEKGIREEHSCSTATKTSTQKNRLVLGQCQKHVFSFPSLKAEADELDTPFKTTKIKLPSLKLTVGKLIVHFIASGTSQNQFRGSCTSTVPPTNLGWVFQPENMERSHVLLFHGFLLTVTTQIKGSFAHHREKKSHSITRPTAST